MPKIFVSYSHDSELHRERVLALADRLRTEGLDCALDRYEPMPPEGWPKWMARQILDSDFVLVICTDIYARRARGEEELGRGLGATWEGQLITQALYESGGRNGKFLPIVFDKTDIGHIPEFLLSATRFNVSVPADYESLYRLLTQQPAVLRPALGFIKTLRAQNSPVTSETEPLAGAGQTFVDRRGPTIVWRLPRGFVLLEDLEPEPHSSWATVASYYHYDGEWIHSTHYHESYKWHERSDGIDRQCAKLHIPRGDWLFAYAPIDVMMAIRHRTITVSGEGTLQGLPLLDKALATVHPPGGVDLPRAPSLYRGLAVSGRLRDLAMDADTLLVRVGDLHELSTPWLPDIDEDVRKLRREVRVDVHRMLSNTHPAVKNLEEIIEAYRPDPLKRIPWLREFASAINEACRCLELQTA